MQLSNSVERALALSTSHLRVTGSKPDTAVTPATITPRTTPPAITELIRFFNDGVTAAWAARGLERAAPMATVRAAGTARVCFCALHNTQEQNGQGQRLCAVPNIRAALLFRHTFLTCSTQIKECIPTSAKDVTSSPKKSLKCSKSQDSCTAHLGQEIPGADCPAHAAHGWAGSTGNNCTTCIERCKAKRLQLSNSRLLLRIGCCPNSAANGRLLE